jgi:uncharacterized protein YndB with AHSA1/START domain
VATVTGYIDVSPAEVYSVLASGWYYSGWIVATSHMQAVDEAWPAAGSRLFHASGIWPAAMVDETSVDAVTPNERLVMTARVRPFGEARIEITLTAEGAGTRVTLSEIPISGPGRWLHNRAADAILGRRTNPGGRLGPRTAEHR